MSTQIELGRSSVAQAEEKPIRTPDNHGIDPLKADTPWFRELKRDVRALPADPNSDKMLSRLVGGGGHVDAQWSGPWTPPDWTWYTVPFQTVSGNVAPLAIPGKWVHLPDSNGPYLLPPEPVVHENHAGTNYKTEPWDDGNDHHLFVYVRDEAAGDLMALYEYYQPWVVFNDRREIVNVWGSSWRRFDLRHGENPAPDTPSTDADGLPFIPLVVRYDEVASGAINHALRFCVNNVDISPTYKWPARTAAHPNNSEAGMPYGTRLRIKAAWWTANADAILGRGTHARVVGEALRKHGCILADGSGGTSLQLNGVADLRWQPGLRDQLNAIPAAAFEVVMTPPMLSIDGPRSLGVNQKGQWKISLLPVDSPVGAGSNVYAYDSNGAAQTFATIDATNRSVVVEHAFSAAGVYIVKPYQDWNTGFGPFKITVQ